EAVELAVAHPEHERGLVLEVAVDRRGRHADPVGHGPDGHGVLRLGLDEERLGRVQDLVPELLPLAPGRAGPCVLGGVHGPPAGPGPARASARPPPPSGPAEAAAPPGPTGPGTGWASGTSSSPRPARTGVPVRSRVAARPSTGPVDAPEGASPSRSTCSDNP